MHGHVASGVMWMSLVSRSDFCTADNVPHNNYRSAYPASGMADLYRRTLWRRLGTDIAAGWIGGMEWAGFGQCCVSGFAGVADLNDIGLSTHIILTVSLCPILCPP